MDRIAIKLNAKLCMREARPAPWLVTVIYMLISSSITLVFNYQEYFDVLLQRSIPAIEAFIRTTNFTFMMLAIFAFSLFVQVVAFGYSKYCLMVSRRQQASYATLFDGFTLFFKVLGLFIVMGFFVFCWSLLFIIPGIIASFAYSQAVFILIDDPSVSITKALKLSRQMMRGYKLDYFILQLSFLGWELLIPFTLGIIAIWLTPYIQVTTAGFYNELCDYTPEPQVADGPSMDGQDGPNFWEGQ